MIYLLTFTTILFACMTAYFVSKSLRLKIQTIEQRELITQFAEHNQMLEFKLRMQDSAIRQSWKRDVLDAEIIG